MQMSNRSFCNEFLKEYQKIQFEIVDIENQIVQLIIHNKDYYFTFDQFDDFLRLRNIYTDLYYILSRIYE